MRKMALLLLLVGCFPDADKLRTKGGPTPPPGTGGTITIGGAGGLTGTGGAGGLTGTGGGAGGTGGAPSANRAALCDELANAAAAKTTQCAPFLQAFRYGSQAAQAARTRLNCNLYDLPSVHFPPSPFKPCADALAAQSCSDWADGAVPAACLGAGALAAGATCTSGYQCVTDLCDIPDTGCGKCVTLPAAGDPCLRGYCAAGAVCNMAGTCVTPGRTGAPCDDANAPCASSLGCHAGTCGPLGGPGAACASDGECDVYHGSFCYMKTKCVSVTAGSMCTMKPDGSFVFCSGGARCNQTDGTCTPPAADGGSCSDQGPDCVWPAQCLSDMKCHLFQPNRTCLGTPAVRTAEPGVGLLPAGAGVAEFWRSLVPKPLKHNY